MPISASCSNGAWRSRCCRKKVFSTAAPGRPLFLAFEDVHWIDPTSAEFLENLVRNAPDHACAVIATTRPEGAFADRLDASGEVVRLQRLSDEQSVELAKAAGHATRAGRQTSASHRRESDGVPLFLEEYASMLAESARQQGGQQRADVRNIPLTLGGLVQNKLDRLNPHAQLVARIGATIGRVFDSSSFRLRLSNLARSAFGKALDASGRPT